MNPQSLQLKNLINIIEKKWKEYGMELHQNLMNKSITRLNAELQTLINDFDNSWTLMIIKFQETFDQILPLFKDAVNLEYVLHTKEELLENQRTEFITEKEFFESQRKKYEEMYHLPSEILELNVGGSYFCTLKSTLTNIVPDSMLSSMFSGRWPITKDINGYCFIDRDPHLFQLLLNGLRNNGHWIKNYNNPKETNGLMLELDYFCLKMFIEYNDYREYTRLYVMGGCNFNNPNGMKKVHSFDLKTKKWRAARDLPTIENNPASVFVSTNDFDRIYLIGDAINYLDPIKDEWIKVNSISKKHTGHSIVYFDENIYIIGGYNVEFLISKSSSIKNHVECYNIKTDCYMMKSPMQVARSEFAAIILDGQIYVMGGVSNFNYSNAINSAEKYNPYYDKWTVIINMLVSRKRFSAVTIQNHIYALGGVTNNNIVSNSVECYNPDSNEWKLVHPMNDERCFFAAVGVNMKIYVFGGSFRAYDYSDSITNSCEVYDTEYNEWKNIPKMKMNRYKCTAAGI